MKRTLIALVVLTLAVPLFAQPRGAMGPGRGPQGPGPQGPGPQGPGPAAHALLPPPALAEFLGLTEAQQTQIESLRTQTESTVQPLRDELRANQEAIEEAVAAGNAARAGELLIANSKLRAQIKAAHDAFKSGFEALLTAAQKEKWAVYQEIVELRGKRPE